MENIKDHELSGWIDYYTGKQAAYKDALNKISKRSKAFAEISELLKLAQAQLGDLEQRLFDLK